ncbi:hypothetical protein [Schumannella luteola]
MYIALVLLQTLVLPLASGVIHLVVAGGHPLVVFGIWWAFWGVGTRLVVAGISQLANPARTAQGILGMEDKGAEQVVHELGFANLCLGAVALVAPFIPGWGYLGALPGALYLGLAGFRHVAKRSKGRDETVATWTDILVFVAVVAGLVGMLVA